MQVFKAITQVDFEAGNVGLAVAVAAVSGPESGSMVVKSADSTTTVLPSAPSMVVTVVLDAGHETSIAVAGGWPAANIALSISSASYSHELRTAGDGSGAGAR
jgi:hypothetical protein